MGTERPATQSWVLAVGLVVAFGVAVWLRWRGLAVTSALGDAMGPWWVGARGPLRTTPHAPPYGWMLALPHGLLVRTSGSLWQAVAGMHVLHAMIAPIGGLATARLARKTGPGLVVAALLAVEPGLLDTCLSGAEGYLAAVALGLVTLGTTSPTWGPWLVAVAFPWAVMNHPLALVAGAPLLILVPWSRGPLIVLGSLLLPHLGSLVGEVGGAVAPSTSPLTAVDAWLRMAGVQSLVLGLAMLGGLWTTTTRRWTLAALSGLVLTLAAGAAVGALKDHHLRMLMVPLMVGVAGIPGRAYLGLWLALRIPADPVQRPSQGLRPGTLGLLHHTAQAIDAAVPGPLVVEGAVVSGVPAVEPGALVLALSMAGRGAEGFSVDGTVAVVVTADRTQHDPIPDGLHTLAARDTWQVRLGTPAEVYDWTGRLCAVFPQTRRQSAQDAWPVVHPEAEAAELDGSWGCGLR